MNVQRYLVACDPYVAWSLLIQVEPEGEWVKHKDHARTVTALEAEVARLREALEEYGDHSPRCAWHADQPHNPTDCDCGYDTALAPAAQKDVPRG